MGAKRWFIVQGSLFFNISWAKKFRRRFFSVVCGIYGYYYLRFGAMCSISRSTRPAGLLAGKLEKNVAIRERTPPGGGDRSSQPTLSPPCGGCNTRRAMVLSGRGLDQAFPNSLNLEYKMD